MEVHDQRSCESLTIRDLPWKIRGREKVSEDKTEGQGKIEEKHGELVGDDCYGNRMK